MRPHKQPAHPTWTGRNAGYNALFDMGIALGEIIIACRPKLRWDVDPISAILPRTAKMLKRSRGMSFQRPELTGFDDPTRTASPLHEVYMFAHQMSLYNITRKGALKLRSFPRGISKGIVDASLVLQRHKFQGELLGKLLSHLAHHGSRPRQNK